MDVVLNFRRKQAYIYQPLKKINHKKERFYCREATFEEKKLFVLAGGNEEKSVPFAKVGLADYEKKTLWNNRDYVTISIRISSNYLQVLHTISELNNIDNYFELLIFLIDSYRIKPPEIGEREAKIRKEFMEKIEKIISDAERIRDELK